MKFFQKRSVMIAILFVAALFFYGLFGLTEEETKFDLTKIQYPKSYNELYSLINSDSTFIQRQYLENTAVDTEKNSTDYSKTNIQVDGVDEADVVKTDGDYIYILNDEYLYIVKALNGNMEIMSKIKSYEEAATTYSRFLEMYVSGNKLIVIKSKYSNVYYPMEKTTEEYLWNKTDDVSVVVFDITDKANPVKESELSQSGYYLSSRMIDNYLYIVTNYYIYSEIEEDDAKTFVPLLTTDEVKPMNIEDIMIMPNPNSSSYLIVTGIDVNDATDFVSSKAILGSSSNIYADVDNLYIAGYSSKTEGNTYISQTSLLKFSMSKGVLKLDATGTVNGYILNQFSMDEYDGHFRIVTTSNDYIFNEDPDLGVSSIIIDSSLTKNNLYILDSELNVVGKLEDLAKGESVYSVRFDEEVVYFVTFRRTDPLFVVDVSNPREPIIQDELKIPGFSEYLHVYDEKYLFGLGKEADEEGRVASLKISMYDVSDKKDVTEEYKLLIGDKYSWSEAYNHKAILVSKDKALIAFPVDNYYAVYRFTEGVGFKEIAKMTVSSVDKELYYYSGNIRGLYIDDYLYVINQTQIQTLNINTLELGSSFELNGN